jgi:hypothetical protein
MKHVIVRAGSGPCPVIAIGARERSAAPGSLGFNADEVAKRQGASVEEDTMDGGIASPTRHGGRMKAIVSERYGLDALELREVDRPVIEDDQVLVRVHASSVNPVEWYRVTGPYFPRLLGEGLRKPKRTIVGGDLAGRVEAVGRDVQELHPGDEVFGTTVGAWAEYAPARESRLVRKPANLSFEEAAAVPSQRPRRSRPCATTGESSPDRRC